MSSRHRPLAAGESAAALVPGPSGQVGGSLRRRIAAPPCLDPAAAFSGSHAGREIGAVFPNLARAFAGRRFREAATRPGRLGKAGAGDRPRFVAGEGAVAPQRRPERLGAVLDSGEPRSGRGAA